MDEKALEPFDGEVGDHGRHREPESKYRKGHGHPGKHLVDWMAATGGQPSSRLPRDPAQPGRLGAYCRLDLDGDDRAAERQENGQDRNQTGGGHDFVDNEVHDIGAGASAAQGTGLTPERSGPLDQREQRAQGHKSQSDIRPTDGCPGQQAPADEGVR